MRWEEIHKIRLENDYKAMCCIADSPMVSWIATKGTAPYVEEYLLTINVRTYSGPGKIMEQCKVRIRLPEKYPQFAPRAVMEGPVVFHPNWYVAGQWDYGMWRASENLESYVVKMIRTLQFDPRETNLYSPSNHDAKNWYLNNKELFPSDTQTLPNLRQNRDFKIIK